MRILLDTNTYSAVFRGDQRVASLIRRAEKVYFSTVVIAELLAGFRRGRREQENRAQLGQFLADPAIEELAVDRETAEHYASIWNELRAKGRPIPANDVWIAAHTRQVGAELLTFDRHFQEVDGLRWTLLEPGSAP